MTEQVNTMKVPAVEYDIVDFSYEGTDLELYFDSNTPRVSVGDTITVRLTDADGSTLSGKPTIVSYTTGRRGLTVQCTAKLRRQYA